MILEVTSRRVCWRRGSFLFKCHPLSLLPLQHYLLIPYPLSKLTLAHGVLAELPCIYNNLTSFVFFWTLVLMAYDLPYDVGFSRSLSRRPSMGYAVSAPAAYGHGGYIDSGLGVGTFRRFI